MPVLPKRFIRQDLAMKRTAGFTLLETLLAVAITSIMATVLFSAWKIMADSSVRVRQEVSGLESAGVLPTVLDSDLAGLYTAQPNPDAPLPFPLFRTAFRAFSPAGAAAGLAEDASSANRVLLAFPTTTSLVRTDPRVPSGPVCVEYVLRSSDETLLRREREFCGVDGLFPWTEHVLARQVRAAEFAVYIPGEGFREDWEAPLAQTPGALRLTVHRGKDDNALRITVPIAPTRTPTP